jgi:hypothetical protein
VRMSGCTLTNTVGINTQSRLAAWRATSPNAGLTIYPDANHGLFQTRASPLSALAVPFLIRGRR